MPHTSTAEPIVHTVTVPLPPAEAFHLFVDGLTNWWPADYTWAAEVLEAISIEPRLGGRCFERGPCGFECDWGRVTAWDPPHRLSLTWQISLERVPEPNPARASEVVVRLAREAPSSTGVTLEHRGFERHGDGGAQYRAALASPQGWPYILDRYAATAQAADPDT